MYIDPEKLLPQHQHLLLVDMAELGEGPLAKKQVWISNMEAERLANEEVDEARTRGGRWTNRTRTGISCGWINKRIRRTLVGTRK